ncbi:hypothetical protein BH20VER1_BH20VER1_02650 [soil metagenome]
MLDPGVYLLYRAASALVALLPLRLIYSLGQLLGLCAWLLSGPYRRLAFRNLQIALGFEKSDAELHRLTRRHFARLGANLLSTVKLGTMSLEQVAERVTLEGEDLVHAELRAGRSVVVTLSHLGNWELFAQVFPKHFGHVPLGTVYQPLGNRSIDAHVREKRGRAGVQLFDRQQGFGQAIELLRASSVIGILADQHAGDHGLWTPFFGRLASTTPLPALLAKRTRAALMSAAVYTEGPGRWRMVFLPRFDAKGESVESLTATANRILADQIRRAPEDWFWVHNRWKTPRPNFLLPRYKRGVHLPEDVNPHRAPAPPQAVGAGAPSRPDGAGAPPRRAEDAPPPETTQSSLQPFRILIRGTNWLGDSVISAAAVRAIKRGRPDAHITVATPEKLTAVWRLIPEVDEVLPLGRSLSGTVGTLRKQKPFDVAILFPNSLRTALEVWLAGIPRRVGFSGHHRALLLNQIVPKPEYRGPIRHQLHRYLHLAETLGAEITTTVPAPPERPPQPQNGLIKLALCPGAEYGPAKRWLPERFAEVATTVAAENAVQWVLFGTSSDAQNGAQIAEQLGDKCINRIGQTTLEQLITELRECHLLLTNDTGTMHLATLLGVPVIAIFGSTEHRLTGPLGTGHQVIRHHVECSPCFLRECPIDFRCMKAVTAEEVTAAVLNQLRAAPPGIQTE